MQRRGREVGRAGAACSLGGREGGPRAAALWSLLGAVLALWGCLENRLAGQELSRPLRLQASGPRLMAEQCFLVLGAARDLYGTVAPEP